MPRLVVGARLPDPYFGWIRNRMIAVIQTRKCDICGFEWPTAEIPIAHRWGGSKAECCYKHFTPGIVQSKIDPEKAKLGKWDSAGLLRVMAFGGVYRRRECTACEKCGHSKKAHKEGGCTKVSKFNYKQHPGKRYGEYACECNSTLYERCLDENGKPTRWSTGEFSPDGIVVMDITRCPRCRGTSKVLRRSNQQLGARLRIAKHWGEKRKDSG